MIDPSETPVALKTGLQVDRQRKHSVQSGAQDEHMEDSLEIASFKGAEGYVKQEDLYNFADKH